MGQESSALRGARRASWVLRFLPDVQATRARSTFSRSGSIHRMLVRFSLWFDFADSSTRFSRHFVVYRSRSRWSHFMGCVRTLTGSNKSPRPTRDGAVRFPTVSGFTAFATAWLSSGGYFLSTGNLQSLLLPEYHSLQSVLDKRDPRCHSLSEETLHRNHMRKIAH
jgi:hypothetical protein